MILTLLPDTDPILRQVAEPVTVFDEDLAHTVYAMASAMGAHRGIGLAAPQVGIAKRIIVAQLSHDQADSSLIQPRVYALVNPEIVGLSGQYKCKEGCLTFPGLFLDVTRARTVTVKYQGLDGKEHTIKPGF